MDVAMRILVVNTMLKNPELTTEFRKPTTSCSPKPNALFPGMFPWGLLLVARAFVDL